MYIYFYKHSMMILPNFISNHNEYDRRRMVLDEPPFPLCFRLNTISRMQSKTIQLVPVKERHSHIKNTIGSDEMYGFIRIA